MKQIENTFAELPIATGRKTALVRVDFSIPMDPETKTPTDTLRIQASKATVDELIKKGYKVSLCSHFNAPDCNLGMIADKIGEILGYKVIYVNEVIGEELQKALQSQLPNELILLKNIREEEGELDADFELAEDLMEPYDIYVNDAFSVCHRNHASVSVAPFMVYSYIGRALENELSKMEAFISKKPYDPKHSVVILGGEKLSKMSGLIEKALNYADTLAVVDEMACTFLLAKGFKSNLFAGKAECNMVKEAKRILDLAEEKGKKIILPQGFTVIDSVGKCLEFPVDQLPQQGWEIVDISIRSNNAIIDAVAGASIVIFSGVAGKIEEPVSVSGNIGPATGRILKIVGYNSQPEKDPSRGLSSLVCSEKLHSLVTDLSLENEFTCVSMANGAALAYVLGERLPGLDAFDISYPGCDQ